MAGRRRGWFRPSESNEWIEAARARLAEAFLEMDRRQSAAEAAVHAADQIYPERGHAAGWEPVRARCYAAAGAYLSLTEELEKAEREKSPFPQGQQRADTVTRQLVEATRGVDEFYRGNQSQLEQALAVLGSVPQLAQQVKLAAAQVRGEAVASEFAGYPSVRARSAAVDEALITVEAAELEAAGGGRGAAAKVRTAATRLEAATAELADALAQAPSRLGAARTAITSVNTRLSAVRTRAERLDPAYSALLREFNAASSADLANNGRESQRDMDAAAAALEQARAAMADNNPELALELTATARGNLAEAERQVDAVTKRLALLRAVRTDPQDKVKAVRFRLRDAQMLAVRLGLVAEWGSVLDAQVDRIDRITESLTGRHPDYWAYVTELDAVTEFIAGVVDRMRKQAGNQRE
ncbi:hypothetical protein [Nocardia goodfellowii]|uniref:Tetratricopeptide (TPR) repeat protein n=1 Tax=Nocardia goodfellowii TaxID=882446 RepID=A0ABS4Q9H6_9NOCA|nr:hypothetical protein [Nocardia goodfellowii]MBP2188344.1 tetratricopeptide (TPR) repeat protein [Nocardia goodfellowii]